MPKLLFFCILMVDKQKGDERMLRVIGSPCEKVKLNVTNEVKSSPLYNADDIQRISRVSRTKLIKMKEKLSIYNTEHGVELVFEKSQVTDRTHHIDLVSLTKKELWINDGLLVFHPSQRQ